MHSWTVHDKLHHCGLVWNNYAYQKPTEFTRAVVFVEGACELGALMNSLMRLQPRRLMSNGLRIENPFLLFCFKKGHSIHFVTSQVKILNVRAANSSFRVSGGLFEATDTECTIVKLVQWWFHPRGQVFKSFLFDQALHQAPRAVHQASIMDIWLLFPNMWHQHNSWDRPWAYGMGVQCMWVAWNVPSYMNYVSVLIFTGVIVFWYICWRTIYTIHIWNQSSIFGDITKYAACIFHSPCDARGDHSVHQTETLMRGSWDPAD